MPALLKLLNRSASQEIYSPYSEITHHCRLLAAAQMLLFKVAVIEAVHKEVNKIRANCLCSLFFQQFNKMIVRRRQEFNEYLAHDSHFRLLLISYRQIVELANHITAYLLVFSERHLFARNKFHAALLPLLMKSVSASRFFLVWTHSVEASHEYVSEDCRIYRLNRYFGRYLKARILLQSA